MSGSTEWSGEFGDFKKKTVGFFEIISGDGFSALEKKSEDVKAFFVAFALTEFFAVVVFRGESWRLIVGRARWWGRRRRSRGGRGREVGTRTKRGGKREKTEFESGSERWVARMDDVTDVLDELRDGDVGGGGAAEKVANEGIDPDGGGWRGVVLRRWRKGWERSGSGCRV